MRIHHMLIAYTILVTYTRNSLFIGKKIERKLEKEMALVRAILRVFFCFFLTNTRHAFTAVYSRVYTQQSWNNAPNGFWTSHSSVDEMHTVYFHHHQRQFFPGNLVRMLILSVAMRWECDTYNIDAHCTRTTSMNVVITLKNRLSSKVHVSNHLFSFSKTTRVGKYLLLFRQDFSDSEKIKILYSVTEFQHVCNVYQYTFAHHCFVSKRADKFRFRMAK